MAKLSLKESIAKLKALSEEEIEDLDVVMDAPADNTIVQPINPAADQTPVEEASEEDEILKKIELANEELEKSMDDQEFPEEIKESVRKIIKLKEEEIRSELEDEMETKQKEFEEELVDKTDDYLTAVAEEWLNANKVAVKESVQLSNVRKFVVGFKKLLEETHIDLPADTEEVINQYKEENDKLQDELADKIEESFNKSKQIRSLKKALIIEKKLNSVKLAESEKSKLRKICEEVEFDNEEKFEKDIDREVKDAIEEEEEIATAPSAEVIDDKSELENAESKLAEAIRKFRK